MNKTQTITGIRTFLKILTLVSAGVILLGYEKYPALLTVTIENWLWEINSLAIFSVMALRPLSDLLPKQKWLADLLPLRKELGVLSALIVVMFGVVRYMSWGLEEFLTVYFSADYWPAFEPVFWGRIGELVAVPLLLTSNKWSIKTFKKNWKRIQKLVYVYFFAGGYYVYVAFDNTMQLWLMITVIVLTVAAYVMKKKSVTK